MRHVVFVVCGPRFSFLGGNSIVSEIHPRGACCQFIYTRCDGVCGVDTQGIRIIYQVHTSTRYLLVRSSTATQQQQQFPSVEVIKSTRRYVRTSTRR